MNRQGCMAVVASDTLPPASSLSNNNEWTRTLGGSWKEQKTREALSVHWPMGKDDMLARVWRRSKGARRRAERVEKEVNGVVSQRRKDPLEDAWHP